MSDFNEMRSRAASGKQSKVDHYTRKSDGAVDASDYEIPGQPVSSGQTYVKKMVNPRAYKRGGAVEGEEGNKNASRKARKDGGGNWIKGAIKHPGALHKELGVPEGKKIPEKKLEKAEHSKNPTERKRANLAETLKGMHKADGGRAQNPEVSGTRPTGGRIAKASGGSAWKYLQYASPEEARAARTAHFSAKDENGMRSSNAARLMPNGKVAYKGEFKGPKPVARVERADGGRAKGKTNITIVVAPQKEEPPMGAPGMPPGMPPVPPTQAGPVKPPMPMPPPGGMPPGGPPPGPPPQMQPPMRAAGGKVGR